MIICVNSAVKHREETADMRRPYEVIIPITLLQALFSATNVSRK